MAKEPKRFSFKDEPKEPDWYQKSLPNYKPPPESALKAKISCSRSLIGSAASGHNSGGNSKVKITAYLRLILTCIVRFTKKAQISSSRFSRLMSCLANYLFVEKAIFSQINQEQTQSFLSLI